MATDYWPDPRFVGVTYDPSLWFVTGQTANVQCIATGEGGGGGESMAAEITEADKGVMDGTFEAVKGYDAGLWEAQLRLYGRLSQYPELRPADSEAANWYAAQENTTVASLGDLYQSILLLNDYSAQVQSDLEQADAAQQSAAEAVTDKDGLIAENLDNPAALEQHIAERIQLEEVLTDAIAAHQSLLSTLYDARQSAALLLLEQVEIINTTETFEIDFKTVCRILLETSVSGSGVSETNRQVLTSIAHQCRYEGGFAVLQARASLGEEWDWSAYDNCPDAVEGRTSNIVGAVAVNLYPNPAKDAALLDLGNTVTKGRAILRDLSGRVLQEWALDGQRQVWLRWSAEYSSGLYLLEIIADQAAPQVLKMAIERN